MVQRYKQLAKGDADNITWPYYESMQKWFNEDSKLSDNSAETAETSKSIIEGEGKQQPMNEKSTYSAPTTQKSNMSIDCIKIQLLTELKVTQEKLHGEIMGTLNSIRNSLDKIIPVESLEVIESESTFS